MLKHINRIFTSVKTTFANNNLTIKFILLADFILKVKTLKIMVEPLVGNNSVFFTNSLYHNSNVLFVYDAKIIKKTKTTKCFSGYFKTLISFHSH